jgi:hypothetical protein
MANIVASVEFIGFDHSRSFYRVDLGQVPWSAVQSISFLDDGVKLGGTGGASGADIDFVAIAGEWYASPDNILSLVPPGNTLQADVVYNPGFMAQWVPGDLGPWDTSHFFGTAPGNGYDPAQATLGVADGDLDASLGTLSLARADRSACCSTPRSPPVPAAHPSSICTLPSTEAKASTPTASRSSSRTRERPCPPPAI